MTKLSIAKKAAKAGAKILLKYFETELKVDYKKHNEVVTQADKDSERKIISIIRKAYPSHGIWSEESPEKKMNSNYKWVIDPLDGTRTFIQGLPFWGIAIALEYKGEPIVAVNYFPVLKLLYHAEKGKGAFKNGKRIFVSKNTNSDDLYFYVSSEIFRYVKYIKPFEKKLITRKYAMKSLGSTALELSYLAEGKADACFEFRIKPCDVRSGLLLVEEAGGEMMTISGKKVSFDDSKIIAHNGKIKSSVNIIKEK